MSRKKFAFGFLIAMAVAIGLIWVLLDRIPDMAGFPEAKPAAGYDEARSRLSAMGTADLAGAGSPIHARCQPLFLTQGHKVEHAVVLFHGFTNCPMQFRRLAQELHRRGMNVIVPRFPHHGLRDRMTTELSKLTADELAEAGSAAIDVARGLGERITVVGLSSTAVTAAWLAEHRADIDHAILIAPSFAPKGLPAPIARRMTGALFATPNRFVWWNPAEREALPGPTHCYPRFSTHALAQIYRLGFAVAKEAESHAPAAKRIDIVVSEVDTAVNNERTLEIADAWRAHGARVRDFEFPAWTKIQHDMIDPDQPYERVGLSYPPLVALITESPDSLVDSTQVAPARLVSR